MLMKTHEIRDFNVHYRHGSGDIAQRTALSAVTQSGHQATLAIRLRASAEAKLLRVRSICDFSSKKSSNFALGRCLPP